LSPEFFNDDRSRVQRCRDRRKVVEAESTVIAVQLIERLFHFRMKPR
jgi:hypothetical protein